MPSYRVAVTVGALRPGVDPARVVDILSEAAAESTTVEASNVGIVRGEPRVIVRFTGDDDRHARRIGADVRAAAEGIAQVGGAALSRRDGGRWTEIPLGALVLAAPVPALLRHGYTADQVRAAEEPLLARGEPLMQRAATALADVVRDLVVARNAGEIGGTVLVLAGPGNNGADAMWAASFLAAEGIAVTVLRCAERVDPESHAAAVAAGAGSFEADVLDASAVSGLAARSDIVVDGLFGNGARGQARALNGTARATVEAVLEALGEGGPLVVAVDLPSGIGADDGSVPQVGGRPDPVILPADVTVTFGAAKAGLLLDPARHLVGELVIVDIGLGPELEKVAPGR